MTLLINGWLVPVCRTDGDCTERLHGRA